MPSAKRNIISEPDIFVDRRQPNSQPLQSTTPCRRQNNFHKAESSAWWLQVNYVKQHLRSVGDH